MFNPAEAVPKNRVIKKTSVTPNNNMRAAYTCVNIFYKNNFKLAVLVINSFAEKLKKIHYNLRISKHKSLKVFLVEFQTGNISSGNTRRASLGIVKNRHFTKKSSAAKSLQSVLADVYAHSIPLFLLLRLIRIEYVDFSTFQVHNRNYRI